MCAHSALKMHVGAGHQEVLQAVRDAVDAEVAIQQDFPITDAPQKLTETLV